MNYTVKQLSRLAGVSGRTLHYYDEIGLLRPSSVGENGYRYYGDKEIARLQQILFFKELDFSLEKITHILSSPTFDSIQALEDQRKLLELKKERLGKLIETISKTIKLAKGGENMKNDDKFSPFNDPTYQKYKDEVEERWGKSKYYQQSQERVGKLSKVEFEKIKNEGGEITLGLARLKNEGFSSDSDEVQEQIDRFYNWLKHFYDPDLNLFRGLGQMYVEDNRFREVYEKQAIGLAEFKRNAINYYADQKSR